MPLSLRTRDHSRLGDTAAFSYKLMYKTGKLLAIMAYKFLPLILATATGDQEYDRQFITKGFERCVLSLQVYSSQL